MFIDDPDGINLGYNSETDTFDINPEHPEYMKLADGDLLRLKIDSYNFAGKDGALSQHPNPNQYRFCSEFLSS
ncbi:hypothetical protein QUF70_15840 [Desulfobacterales bacterium HSG17]|nr:hypothetical protein [Desulfobacterales bacterium HSG17]